jgi:bacteriorhodopsin
MPVALIQARQGVPNPEEFWYWLGCGGFVVGSVIIALLSLRARREDKDHFVVAFFITVIAACSYYAMAVGNLDYRVADRAEGSSFVAQLPRYVDWTLTTPLLLLSVALIALPPLKNFYESRERQTAILSLMFADALMIVTGIFATLNGDPSVKYIWYGISCGFYVATAFILLSVLKRGRQRGGKAPNVKAAQGLGAYLLLLWLAYPIVWIFGPQGWSLWGETADAAIFMFLDWAAKVIFGIMLSLAVLRIGRQVTEVKGRGSVDLATEQLGDGEDRELALARAGGPGVPATAGGVPAGDAPVRRDHETGSRSASTS